MSEKKIYRYGDMMSMPRGIEMKGYYHGDGSITYIGQYLQPNGQPNARPKRVYRIEVRKSAMADAPWWNGSYPDGSLRSVHTDFRQPPGEASRGTSGGEGGGVMRLPWRKIRNAAIFAVLGYAISALDIVLPALAAVWAWMETDED